MRAIRFFFTSGLGWMLVVAAGALATEAAPAAAAAVHSESREFEPVEGDSNVTPSVDGRAAVPTERTPGTDGAAAGTATSALALSASSYTVAQAGGSVSITVNRGSGSTAKASVNYATANGTALAGGDYTARNGVLRWNRGDTAPKSFTVPVNNTVPFPGSKTFTVTLSNATGGAVIGAPAVASVTINGSQVVSVGYPQPAISGFTPSSGGVGTQVTLYGTGFTGLNTAWVGTAHDALVSVVSDTQVVVTVPLDATTGAIGIFNPSHVAFSATSFTVTGTPTPPPPSTGLSVRTYGNRFIDASGNVVQLRGVNYSGFEFAAIQGWSGNDPSGGQAGQPGGPKWSALQAWKANTVRIPLNEASWLGYLCTDTNGNVHDPDPAGNYRSAVQTQVGQANAAGLYVILDLHWTAPGNACPMLQTQMANADHSIAFWTSVATMFKGNPAVLFELFNEPYFNFDFSGDSWSYMMHGTNGAFSGYPAMSRTGNWQDVKQPWAVASYQAMLNAVRATGATNVVLVGTMMYGQEFSGWLSHRPTDPLNQMAAVWHPYPTHGATWGTAAYAQPNYAPGVFNEVLAIQAAGIPVIATETGDRNTPGTVGAPLVSNITSWADLHGVSVIGWSWNVWDSPDFVLIKDVNGTPTDGYGQVFRAWLMAH